MRVPWDCIWKRSRTATTAWIVLLCLLCGGRIILTAQSSGGGIAGKLTDLYARPLAGASIVLRNEETGATAQTTSGKDGSYRLKGLAPGEYTLEAVTTQKEQGRVAGLIVMAGHDARVLVALELSRVPSAQDVTAQLPVRPERDGLPQQGTRPEGRGVEAAETGRTASKLDSKASAGAKALVENEAPAARLKSCPSYKTQPGASVFADCVPQAQDSAKAVSLSSSRPVAENLASRLEPAAFPEGAAISASSAPGSAGGALLASVARVLAGSSHPELECVAVPLHDNTIHLQALAQAALPLMEFEDRSAALPAIATEPVEGLLTATISSEQLQALPLAGRNWEDILTDRAARSNQSEPEADQPNRDSAVAMDGFKQGSAFGGNSERRGGNISAVREMRVVEGGAAFSERSAIETRAGGNHLHGEGSVFARQNMGGAQNPFTAWVKETAPATLTTTPVFAAVPYTPADRETIWGVGLGGPLRRDRLFFFAALDRDQRDHPAVATVKHPDHFFAQPSDDEMQVLAARLGLSSANPVAEGIQAYSDMLESMAGLLGPAPRTASHWTGFGRIDWKAAPRHRFLLEGRATEWNSPGGGMTRASASYGIHSFGTSRASSSWTMGRWESNPTAHLVSTIQGSAGRHIASRPAETPSGFEQTFARGVGGQLPEMVVDSRYGFTIGAPAGFGAGSSPDEHIYELRQSLGWTRGPLRIESGFTFSHDADATSFLANRVGTYHYTRIENFVSDALVFAKYGVTDAIDPLNQHNCDPRGKAWRATDGRLYGLGYLPCYSYYTQTLGPSQWRLSSNDWSAFSSARWEPTKGLVLTAALRWEWQQMPPPIAGVDNPDLPLTRRPPALGNEWGPRLSLAWGTHEGRLPVLQLGYGVYFNRTNNAVVETALTHTGSPNGDLRYFVRATDDLPDGGGAAPPFPLALTARLNPVQKPTAVEFASGFRNGAIQQASATLEETLPGRVHLSAGSVLSLGRRLPVTIDTNFDPALNPRTITYGIVDPSHKGPLQSAQVTVPFFASWPTAEGLAGRLNPNYQQTVEIMSRANSTNEAASVRIVRNMRQGLSVRARYTYAHLADWNPNESSRISGSSVLDPTHFDLEYGASNLDVRHSASLMFLWDTPWRLKQLAGHVANNWTLSGIGSFQSGLPYTMHTSGSLAEEFTAANAVVAGLGPGMNGYGGAVRVYGAGRNSYRYPAAWKADVRIGRRFVLGHERELQLLAESFNLFNHSNATELETVGYVIEPGNASGGLPTLNFLSGLKSGQAEFGKPLSINATDYYRPRQFQFGVRIRY